MQRSKHSSESSSCALSDADLQRLKRLATDPHWYPNLGRETDWEEEYRATVARLVEHIDAINAKSILRAA